MDKIRQDLHTCCLQETHFLSRNTYTLKVTEWKKAHHANGNQKKAGVVVLRQNKLQNKDCNKIQRKTVHNVKGINPKKDNKCKQVFTQHDVAIV